MKLHTYEATIEITKNGKRRTITITFPSYCEYTNAWSEARFAAITEHGQECNPQVKTVREVTA